MIMTEESESTQRNPLQNVTLLTKNSTQTSLIIERVPPPLRLVVTGIVYEPLVRGVSEVAP